MWHKCALFRFVAFALCSPACDTHHEVVATERLGAAGNPGEATGGERNDGTGGSDGDGGSSGDGGTSAAGGVPTDPQRPIFDAPTAVDGLNDPDAKDQDPTVTSDQLEIFFFTDRDGNADIWTSTRDSVDDSWAPPSPVAELNSGDIEQNPTISRDGLRMWFYSRREPLGIYFAERSARDEPFAAPVHIPIASPDPTGFPIAPSVDVAEMRMAISIGESVSRDLFEMVRPSPTGTWGEPAALSGINSAEYAESTPFLIDDGHEILFHSGRAGSGDLFWAHRDSPGLPFTQVAPLSEVNDPGAFDSYPHLTVDRQWLYFGSDRGGNTDIYVARRVER